MEKKRKKFSGNAAKMTTVKKVHIKISVLGPVKCGKSSIANYLADSEQAISREYRPTQGVRIVEFESDLLELDGRQVNAEVELWDCSGDRNFADCWPAIRDQAHGAILVCNPNVHTGSDLLPWYNEFALKGKIYRKNLIIFAHNPCGERSSADGALAGFQVPAEMADIMCFSSNIERNGEELRIEFNNYLCNIIINSF